MQIKPISFITGSNLKKLSYNTQNPLLNKAQFDSINFSSKKITAKEAIEDFKRINVQAKQLKNGKLALDSYEPHNKDYLKLKNSEDALFELVGEITGYANFENSKLTSTKALEKIGQNAIFSYSKIEEIPNLKTIGKDAYLNNSNISNTKGLKVGRSIIIEVDKVNTSIVNSIKGEKLNISDWGDNLVRIYNDRYSK